MRKNMKMIYINQDIDLLDLSIHFIDFGNCIQIDDKHPDEFLQLEI